MRPIKNLIVHCSDSGFGDAALIRKWHKEERGWSDIGYHHVILNGRRRSVNTYKFEDDGLLEAGRAESLIGSHAEGLNATSIGVCLIGKAEFTVAQFKTLAMLLRTLRAQYPETLIFGHCSADAFGGMARGKTCPNFDVAGFVEKFVDVKEA